MMQIKRLLFNVHKVRRYSSLPLNVRETLSLKPVNQSILIQGWIQSIRKHKNIYFVDVTDGSCIDRLQVIINASDKNDIPPSYMSSVQICGELVKSNHKGQEVELHCKSWKILGSCSDDYPFSNRLKYSTEYIRQFLHLRPKTKTFASILRVRSCATLAIHSFFQEKDFHLINTPIITANDCEGASEVFSIQVNKKCIKPVVEKENLFLHPNNKNSDKKPSDNFFKAVDSDDEGNDANVLPDDKNDEEFFGKPVYLTVSGQLHLEAAASALSKVYTFGPVFRAEGSYSRQHASEFYMIEAEMAFVDTVDSLTKVIELCIKSVAEQLLNKCSKEIDWLNAKYSNTYKEYIENIVSKPFIEMPYSEAISILQNSQQSFVSEPKWGKDFALEHKNYLLHHCNNTPVIVSMFPSVMKPFYMKQNPQGLAYCFDVFAPFGGEICGGSLREDSEQILRNKLKDLNIQDNLSWYIELRKYGGVPLGGFGIGFDRLLQSLLGISNIRDVIPFPRRINDCRC